MPQVAALLWIRWRCKTAILDDRTWKDNFLKIFWLILLYLMSGADFFQWKIVLEFAKRFCWNFHQIQDISQEISETVIQSQKWRRVFRGKWPLEVPKRQKLQTSQARVPLGLAFLQGSRKAAFKAEDQQLFANLYKDGFSGRVCVFFFPWKNNHEVAKEMFGVYIACLKIDLAKTPIN